MREKTKGIEVRVAETLERMVGRLAGFRCVTADDAANVSYVVGVLEGLALGLREASRTDA